MEFQCVTPPSLYNLSSPLWIREHVSRGYMFIKSVLRLRSCMSKLRENGKLDLKMSWLFECTVPPKKHEKRKKN